MQTFGDVISAVLIVRLILRLNPRRRLEELDRTNADFSNKEFRPLLRGIAEVITESPTESLSAFNFALPIARESRGNN